MSDPEPATEIDIAHYLLERLKQLGVSTIFGVPGDFNLGFLDAIEDDPDIDWVGNCNELNAAYAADGYARVKQDSVGVLLTTFGVGELSALNGIAGSYAEMIPIVHIVGVPQRSVQEAKPIIHHTLADGRYDVYTQAATLFTASQAVLATCTASTTSSPSPDTAPTPTTPSSNSDTTTTNSTNAKTRTRTKSATSEIDRVLADCVSLRRPVYIALPTDMVMERVEGGWGALRARGVGEVANSNGGVANSNTSNTSEDVVVETIHARVQGQSRVIILVDVCALRHDARRETLAFVRASGFAVYCTPMGKGVVDEGYARFGGVYIGAFSRPAVKDAVESAGLILFIGSLATDFNTGMFTSKLGMMGERVVQLHSTHTQIGADVFPGVGMKALLPRLAVRLEGMGFRPGPGPGSESEVVPYSSLTAGDGADEESGRRGENGMAITQTWIWPRMSKFFRRGDVVITETGTASFGILEVPLPDDCIFISQILFGSIGYTVGGTLGAAVAARELELELGDNYGERRGRRRTILFIGDGSLQIGVQELSTMIMKGVHPIIFLLNNSGYTIERCVRNPHRKYHDIMNWEWTSLLRVLGDSSSSSSSPSSSQGSNSNSSNSNSSKSKSKSYTVTTQGELSTLLDDPVFAEAGVIQLVEVMLDRFDAPDILAKMAEVAGRVRVRELDEAKADSDGAGL